MADGTADGSVSVAAGVATSLTHLEGIDIGDYVSQSDFEDLIDDVRIYIGSALSAVDVALLAAGGEPATAPTAHWTMDDGPQYGEPSSGDPIAAWESRDGGRYKFEREPAATRPTYLQSGLNGKPGLAFDGTQYLSHGAAILRGKEGTVVVVADYDVSVSRFLLSQGDVAGGVVAFAGIGAYADGAVRWYQINNDTADDLRGADTAAAPKVLAARSDGTLTALRSNGATQPITIQTGANNGDWFSDTDLCDNTVIGARARSTVSGHMLGTIYEILAWNRRLTDSELKRVERFLASKYAFTLAS